MTANKSGPVRIGIIGAGWPGERHTDGYKACGAQVVAVSDLNEARREKFAKNHEVPRTYAQYQELLADPEIDAVSIALPTFLHRPATVAALEAGKHVLCEKPPATTLAEAQQMAEIATRKGLLLSYALQRRFQQPTQELRASIRAGKLGDVYHARAVWTRTWGVPQGLDGWFTDPARAGGGALIDIGVHVLDIAWYLMGCPKPLTVSGQVHNRFPEQTKTDDSAFALVRFADGRGLHLETSWVLTQENDHMAVYTYGTLGGGRVDDGSLEMYTVGANGRGRTGQTYPDWIQGFKGETKNFIDAINGKATLETPAEHGVLLMTMIEGIYRSSTQAREVAL
jgi:predicted dehydrogenase